MQGYVISQKVLMIVEIKSETPKSAPTDGQTPTTELWSFFDILRSSALTCFHHQGVNSQ